MLLKWVTGSEHGKQGNEKWEQNREMENEVTDRARVQVLFETWTKLLSYLAVHCIQLKTGYQ